MFDFDISDELKVLLRKLSKKNKVRAEILRNKIKEIVANNTLSIDRYKNCKYDLKDFKGVHIDKSFVLLFRVYKQENIVYFWKLKHHDEAYK